MFLFFHRFLRCPCAVYVLSITSVSVVISGYSHASEHKAPHQHNSQRLRLHPMMPIFMIRTSMEIDWLMTRMRKTQTFRNGLMRRKILSPIPFTTTAPVLIISSQRKTMKNR